MPQNFPYNILAEEQAPDIVCARARVHAHARTRINGIGGMEGVGRNFLDHVSQNTVKETKVQKTL